MNKIKYGKTPLLTAEYLSSYEESLRTLRKQLKGNIIDQGNYLKQRDAVEQAFTITKVRKAQARADELLDALLVLVGSRGGQYITFEWAFNQDEAPDASAVKDLIAENNTPKSRRDLYTILRALTEIPKTWAMSALIRFLRGTGKQKGSKYHGAGTFGTNYGWKKLEVRGIAEIISSGRWYSNPYCQVLMHYEDMYGEICDAANDYSVDINIRNYATNVERDVPFLNKLCEKLEKRGLGDIPAPLAAKPKRVRNPKIFKAGDLITARTLKDLPLPAHVRLSIKRWDKGSGQWLSATLEQVVISLTKLGRYHCHYVVPETGKAYSRNFYTGEDKKNLDGATFLGEWSSEISTKKVEINFIWKIA